MTTRKPPALPPVTKDGLRSYLRDLGRLPRLTPEEEHELAVRYRRDGDESARLRLVEGNLRFVVSYARRYGHLGVPLLDLIDEGNLGLLEAARRFDPTRQVKFITYAVWWIRQAIIHALATQSRIVALPDKVSAAAAHFRNHVRELTDHLQHPPSQREIADELDLSEADVEALLQLSGEDVSLNQPIRGDDERSPRELGDTIPQEGIESIDEALVHHAVEAQLREALAELNPSEREVVRLRYGLSDGEAKTLQQIGEQMHLSRERIRQIEEHAKAKLRHSRKLHEMAHHLN